MSVNNSVSRTPLHDDGQDDLQRFLANIEAEDPGVRDAREDLAAIHELLDQLVELRRELGLSQKDVADSMGVRQPTISQFETESSDPKLSTLQRYARALGCRVETRLRYGWQHSDEATVSDGTYYQVPSAPPLAWRYNDLAWLGPDKMHAGRVVAAVFSSSCVIYQPMFGDDESERALCGASVDTPDWRTTRADYVVAR